MLDVCPHDLIPGSPGLGTIGVWSGIILARGEGVGAVLCLVGCVAASLVSTHWIPTAASPLVETTKNVSRRGPVCHGDEITPG